MAKTRSNGPMTFSQFAFRVIKGGFTITHEGSDIMIVGGSNKTVYVHSDGKGIYSWSYGKNSPASSQDWDKAFNRLKMTKDEWGWRELQRAAGPAPLILNAPPVMPSIVPPAPGDTPDSINRKFMCTTTEA